MNAVIIDLAQAHGVKRRKIRVPKWLSKDEVYLLKQEVRHNPQLDDDEALRRVMYRRSRPDIFVDESETFDVEAVLAGA